MCEDHVKQIQELQHRLEETEKNTIIAATYGKQLLNENEELNALLQETIKDHATKIEETKQEKYELALKLEARLQTERSLTLELDQLREQKAEEKSLVAQKTQSLEHELQIQCRKVSELESVIEELQTENQQTKEYVALLETQVKESQNRFDAFNTSIHEQSVDESTAMLQSQLMTLTCEKQDLETQLSSVTATVKTSKLKVSHLEKTIAKLESDLEEKECQCTSYFNALEKNKEEITELQMEIESLRLAETDPGRKGNSLFAELEDQRQAMEKQLLAYKTNYAIAKKQCDLKAQHISKMKLQIASLLTLSGNKSDGEYIAHLEESLSSARLQLETLTKQLQQNSSSTSSSSQVGGTDGEENSGGFFKDMYMESQKKIAELDEDLKTVRFDKVALSDRILQLQRKLRMADVSGNAQCAELIKLRVKLDEMAAKKGENLGSQEQSKDVQRVVEKIPGFEEACQVAPCQEDTKEEDVPLKERLIDPNTKQEVDSKDQENRLGKAKLEDHTDNTYDQENEEPEMPKKRAKKCVRMTETVAVQECDGKVEQTDMKKEDGLRKAERKRKVLRKMEAPIVKVPSGGAANECNTQ